MRRCRFAALVPLVIAWAFFGPAPANAGPEHHYALAEHAFDTGGPITSQYHAALYYPLELALRVDGYLVGVEKSPPANIDPQERLQVRDIPDAGIDRAADRVAKGKRMWVSHVLRNRADQPWKSNCSIYNAYLLPGDTASPPLVHPCNGVQEAWQSTRALENSWTAMSRLQQAVSADVATGRYTHVMVLVMGWNTVQEEAVRNFNSLSMQLVRATDGKVNPLVIGVTWPSEWNSKWADPLYKITSFGNKANDADEVGLTWLGVLLHDVLPKAKGDLPLVVVGHSFGSRASSVAACVGPAIRSAGSEPSRADIDMVLNFEGAFPTKRVLGAATEKQREGMRYPGHCANVKRFVMTASAHDSANTLAKWEPYAGTVGSYRSFCKPGTSVVACVKASADGSIDPAVLDSSPHVIYVEASDLITENAYQTGGGAHSDIYRYEHGRLLGALLPAGKAGALQGAGDKK